MNGIMAIVKKELRYYFYSPFAYILAAVFLWLMGTIFTKFVQIYQAYNAAQMFGAQQGITVDKMVMYFFQNMAFIFCMLIPFITMRLFSEEKRQHTLELLLTAPITSFQLVIGKFVAGLLLVGVVLALTLTQVGYVLAWGQPEFGILFVSYLGLFCMLACFMGIGAMVSALCSSPIVAVLLSFMAVVFIYLLPSMGEGLQSSFGSLELGPFLVYLSPVSHYSRMVEGVIHIKDIVYFSSFLFFTVFVTYRIVESHRWR